MNPGIRRSRPDVCALKPTSSNLTVTGDLPGLRGRKGECLPREMTLQGLRRFPSNRADQRVGVGQRASRHVNPALFGAGSHCERGVDSDDPRKFGERGG
jgi:hypothetical protein